MAQEAQRTVTDNEWVRSDPSEYAHEVDAVVLPPTVQEFSQRYDRLIGNRDPFLWKWIYNLFDKFTLSSVPKQKRSDIYEQKTLLTIFVTVLDDLAETDHDQESFKAGRRIPFDADAVRHQNINGSTVDQGVLEYLEDLWKTIDTRITDASRYADFIDVFKYDLRQTFNSMEYSGLVNDNPDMANRAETERYDAYNMTMFPYACVDLMHSPSFDRSELGVLRSILSDLQRMARIGNWITTWERELGEGDISSGVVVCALNRDIIDYDEITAADERDIELLADRIRSHGIEAEFTREWELRGRTLRKRTSEMESVNVEKIVDGIETVMNHHLASEGNK